MIDTSKVIHAPVGGGRYTVTAPIVKEDYGLYLLIEGLELPSTYEVDFSNSEHNGTSVTMIGNSDGVLIPSQFISTGKDVFAFLYHVGVDFGRTVYKFRIPNKLRPDRTNEEPTPEEQSTIDQAISALNDAVAQTAQDVIDADASAQASAESARASSESALSASNSALSAGEYASNALSHAESASASATASAQSAEQSAINSADAQDSAEEAQASASASAQSASASANSASQASASATSASQSASSAQGYASQAQTSAQTASSKASEASGYASTASTKASESAQSASSALGYKNDAEQAKTDAQTAQGKAEDAQTAAETAQGLAEDAQEAAESAAASVSASAAQIAQNEADILKAFPTDSASGSIASFSDGADDIPLKSLIVDINPVQDLSQGDPSPENICPISGWTGMNVQRMGKNLLDASTLEQGGINANNGLDYTAVPDRQVRNRGYVGVVQGVTYTLKVSTTATLQTSYIFFYDINKAFISHIQTISARTDYTFTVPPNCKYIRFKYYSDSNGISPSDITEIQLEIGSAATAYEPYTGTLIPINWHSEAGTVYGGKLDVLSGELVIDRAMVDLGTLNWVSEESTIEGLFRSPTPYIVSLGAVFNQTPICSIFKGVGTRDYRNIAYNEIAFSNSEKYPFLRIRSTSLVGMTGSQVQTFLENQFMCYELAEPITIQLTPNQINSLLGVNNIWADSGDATAEYRADTKLFIERLTAPDSADMIADANITSGKYFMVGNSLYKATANIASGSAVIVGTNCIRKSLSEALNEINS